MLTRLLDESSYGRYNLYLADKLGLETAVYVNELVNIQADISRKEEGNTDSFFYVNRNDMKVRTTLDEDIQISIDKLLQELDLLIVDKDTSNYMKLNYVNLIDFITNKSLDFSNVKNPIKIKAPKETKTERIIKQLKSAIKCKDDELRHALEGWIESVYARPNSFLSKAAVEAFENDLNNYAQGNLDLALSIVRVASINSWKDCTWAINSYLKDQMYNKQFYSNQANVQSKPLQQSQLSGVVF